ncbi:MORN repeat variant family protein [Ectocarpus siliculosus]|uniref:MORN repeat variant family protein n=1 Tax=Ectocarpus siliculosus TaxID=2880 RepID=D7FJI6_ECTSI|nr:MORN repeat variant family protein [Ectocarpus siliculosus]|eukprot:CBJ29089.1 MORN repeat variant family protein [Ectocarpus siliculosus]
MSPRMAAPALGEPEPGEDSRRKTTAHREKLFSTMPKTSYNTHTTASSYTGSNPRSDGGSDIGNISQHSSFSRRSGAGGFGGEECLEEVSSEESDFEDDEEQLRGGGGVGPFAFPPEAPMFVLPLTGLSAARSFPKYQNAMRSGALVPYDSLDRNSAFVVFVSHRWINESSRPTEFWKHGGGQDFGEGSPDVDSAKHTFLVEGLHSILASLPREVAVFLWIDYSCIDQENPESKRKGARSVAAYMQLSDAVFTPYAESLYPSSGGGGGETFANPLGEVCNTPWPNSYRSLQDFCSRAWCRLEVLLCATLPLRDGGFRYFAARGEEGRAQDRPHFVYGEYQRRRNLPPEALARSVDEAWASSVDPLEGFLSNPEDMEAIVHGMGPVRLASRSAASSALGSSVNTTTAVATVATPLHPGDSEERRRATGRASGERERERESSDAVGRGGGGGSGGGRGQGASKGAGRGRTGRELIPPLSETRAMPGLSDEAELVSAARSIATDRLMSPAVKGGRIISSPSPMRKRTAAADSAVGSETRGARGDSSMPGWLWDTVFQYPLSEGDTRTQYSDGSTFVGPLKDGMRHGKGCYFFQDGSRYEGYFKGDKRHGEGTLNLASGGKYVGHWENDLQHGDGTFYFADSSCFKGLWVQGKKKSGVFTYSSGGRYIGELQAGRRHGRGSFLYPDGSSYEGQWQDNSKHGEGTAWYASGNRYVGQWLYGKSHGEGTYYYATGAKYEGQFDGGKCHGRGTYFYANGNKYEGEWKDDMKWGFGTAVYLNKAHYEGHFFMDKRHGFGKMRYSNAGTYEGEWASGKPHGQGTATHKDGEKYVGTYKAGLYHGEGCYWYSNGAVYEGQYRNGRVHGKGRATFPSGDSYAGEWREGAMSGTGVYEFKEEGASYEGDFDNGRMHGVGVYRWPHGDVYRGSWQNDRRSGRGRYEWTELGLTFEGMFHDDRRTGRGSIIFPDGSRYECQWEDDKALDSTAQGSRSVHYRADGTECTIQGDELRNLMRRINEQRMMQPVTPIVNPEAEQPDQQLTAAAIAPSIASTAESVSDV